MWSREARRAALRARNALGAQFSPTQERLAGASGGPRGAWGSAQRRPGAFQARGRSSGASRGAGGENRAGMMLGASARSRGSLWALPGLLAAPGVSLTTGGR